MCNNIIIIYEHKWWTNSIGHSQMFAICTFLPGGLKNVAPVVQTCLKCACPCRGHGNTQVEEIWHHSRVHGILPPPSCGSLIHSWQRWGSLSTLLLYSVSWFKLSHHAFYWVSSSVPAPSTHLQFLLSPKPPPSAPPLLPLPQLHLTSISLFSSFHVTAAIFSPYLEPAILSLSVILRRTPGSFLPERAWSPFPASPPSNTPSPPTCLSTSLKMLTLGKPVLRCIYFFFLQTIKCIHRLCR